MIYVCIPARNEAETVGLVLWKVRKVFEGLGREYQLLVVDDGSTDRTAEALAPYANVLPLTVVRHEQQRGYAASVERLLRLALERTDRPRRDSAVLMHADFTHGPEAVPELMRRLESGADLVVAEGRVQGESSRGLRLLRRWAPLLLRSSVGLPGVRDVLSGFLAVRLSCARLALKDTEGPLLTTDSWAANAELIARLGRAARRVETVAVTERHDLRPRGTRLDALALARQLWSARPRVRAAGGRA